MKEAIPQSVLQVLQRLENSSDINNIDFQHYDACIVVEFTFGELREVIHFEFHNVIHFAFSKEPDEEKTFSVIGASLSILNIEAERKHLLKRIAFSFMDADGNPATYLDRTLFYFCVDGPLSMDIVFESYSIRSIKQ